MQENRAKHLGLLYSILSKPSTASNSDLHGNTDINGTNLSPGSGKGGPSSSFPVDSSSSSQNSIIPNNDVPINFNAVNISKTLNDNDNDNYNKDFGGNAFEDHQGALAKASTPAILEELSKRIGDLDGKIERVLKFDNKVDEIKESLENFCGQFAENFSRSLRISLETTINSLLSNEITSLRQESERLGDIYKEREAQISSMIDNSLLSKTQFNNLTSRTEHVEELMQEFQQQANSVTSLLHDVKKDISHSRSLKKQSQRHLPRPFVRQKKVFNSYELAKHSQETIEETQPDIQEVDSRQHNISNLNYEENVINQQHLSSTAIHPEHDEIEVQLPSSHMHQPDENVYSTDHDPQSSTNIHPIPRKKRKISLNL